MQGLARLGLLPRFQYLSTVSGGGYLGSLLAAWAYRAPGGIAEVQAELASTGPAAGAPVAWWRQYLAYLAPQRGLFTLDTWTLAATYLRNLVLNALVWLPLLALALLVPHALAALVDLVGTAFDSSPWLDRFGTYATWAGVLMVSAGVFLLRSIVGSTDPRTAPPPPPPGAHRLQQPRQAGPRAWIGVQLMLLVGALLLAIGAWWVSVNRDTTFWRGLWPQDLAEVAEALGIDPSKPVLFALLYTGACMYAAFQYESPYQTLRVRVATVALGAVCGLISGILLGGLVTWPLPSGPQALMLAMTALPPLAILAIAVGEVLFVGLTSKWSSDFEREWWARAGAWSSLYTVAYAALFALAFYAPRLLELVPALAGHTLPTWLAIVLASGVVARIALITGRNAPAEQQAQPVPRKRDHALDAVALLLMLALLVGLAGIVDDALRTLAAATAARGLATPHRWLPYAITDVLLVALVLGAVLLVAGSRVNINRFSLHAMYCDRLIRAFLGATRADRTPPAAWPLDLPYREDRQFRAREAEPFIKFDRDDNPIFHWLAPERTPGDFSARKGPFLLVNAALNLVAGRNLAWQERKATSFTFSALHAGSAAPELGYRASRFYAADAGGITLGTAMAVSGAAISPNAGAFSSPVRTFLLTLFNARLGWWLGHPGDASAAQLSGPRFAIVPMLREMLGRTNDKPPWIFVSDGGHFDNLGLYEAVRRGCRYIVAIDAGCDPFRNFDDLGNAIRKIRIDFGVTIQRTGPWRLGGRDLQENGRYCALFDVIYPGLGKGTLLYVKPSLYPKAAGLPIDVLQYAGRSATFPHETTADQFFTESQFESYRALGEFEIAEIAGTTGALNGVVEFMDLAAFRLRE